VYQNKPDCLMLHKRFQNMLHWTVMFQFTILSDNHVISQNITTIINNQQLLIRESIHQNSRLNAMKKKTLLITPYASSMVEKKAERMERKSKGGDNLRIFCQFKCNSRCNKKKSNIVGELIKTPAKYFPLVMKVRKLPIFLLKVIRRCWFKKLFQNTQIHI